LHISSAERNGKDFKRSTDEASGLRFLIIVGLISHEALKAIKGIFKLVLSTAVVENFPIDSDAEFIWVKLLTQESHPVFICSFYRPSNCEVDPLLPLSESLKAIAEKEANHPTVILVRRF